MAIIERLYLQPKQPRLFDHIIQDLQRNIARRLLFMSHVFGRCERLQKEINGHRVFSPNVYAGGDEYILLTPDNISLGNYCFFVAEEPEQMAVRVGNYGRLRAPFSLVVWVDMRKVGEEDDRNTYDVELKVLDAIGEAGIIKRGGIEVTRIYHKAENVFSGFTLDEVDNQFLMSPFFGLRIEFEAWIDEDCNL